MILQYILVLFPYCFQILNVCQRNARNIVNMKGNTVTSVFFVVTLLKKSRESNGILARISNMQSEVILSHHIILLLLPGASLEIICKCEVKCELHPTWLLVDFPSCALWLPVSVLIHMHLSDCSYFTISFLFDLLSVLYCGTVTGDRCGGGGQREWRRQVEQREREFVE